MESSEPVESKPVETQPVKTSRVKMTDKQKADLKKHMDKAVKGGMSASEAKSHRMKMMGRMRRGDSVKKAHKDIMSK
ncbi:MAG: hypothetical protein HWN81_23880 [Candidatus Lokiarchaeota archaeon]|nr:hypothetical protein [Candidatus Lokiarchaeota archaeon]